MFGHGDLRLVLLALIAWKFWPSVAQAWLHPERHFMGNPGFFTISQWPLFGLTFAGIVATAIQFLLMAFGHLISARSPS